MALSLNKEQEKVKLSLEKAVKSTDDISVQVVLVPDVSGSMYSDYGEDGFMKPILQKSIAMASIIDPDEVVQIIPFSNDAFEMGDFSVDSFDDIWTKFSNRKSGWWGGTNYEAPFALIAESRKPKVEVQKSGGFFGMFKKEETVVVEPAATPEPTLIIFLTDGADGGSESGFKTRMNEILSDGHTYVMFIGVNGSKNDYSRLEKIADDKDCVGFVHITDVDTLTSDKFYDFILSGEFGEWFAKFKK